MTLFAGGAVALVGRKIYDVFEERRVTRRRDHQVLDTLVTELAVLRAAAVSNLRTLNDELDMIERTGGQHWLLTPMTPLSTAPYDLVRSDPPKVLRTGETLSALALAQANAMHNNAVADVRQSFKSGSWDDLAENLVKYDRMAIRGHQLVIRYVDQVLTAAGPAIDRPPKGSVLDAGDASADDAPTSARPRVSNPLANAPQATGRTRWTWPYVRPQ